MQAPDTEEWRDVPSYPQLEASSLGRIRRKPHSRTMPNGGTVTYTSKPNYGVKTKARKSTSHVYMGYYYKGIGNVKVHRLVCEAFHGEAPFDGALVLHRDGDGTNNLPGNLKWGTQKENLNHPDYIAYCKTRTGDDSPYRKGLNK